MVGTKLAPTVLLHGLIFLQCFAASSVLQGQQAKPLEWRVEQQPSTSSCSEADLAFASAPEQLALAQSYGAPFHPGMKCESIDAVAFHGARVLRIWQPSVIDDGYGYTLIQPKEATTARLIATGGGLVPYRSHEDDQANLAAMNAMLQTSDAGDFEKVDWLAISLAYLTILSEEPSLKDRNYAPGANEHFQSYTVPGLLSALPALKRKHLLPTAYCQQYGCEVRFYYRTEPVEPLEKATFEFVFADGKIRIVSAQVVGYPDGARKKTNTK